MIFTSDFWLLVSGPVSNNLNKTTDKNFHSLYAQDNLLRLDFTSFLGFPNALYGVWGPLQEPSMSG